MGSGAREQGIHVLRGKGAGEPWAQGQGSKGTMGSDLELTSAVSFSFHERLRSHFTIGIGPKFVNNLWLDLIHSCSIAKVSNHRNLSHRDVHQRLLALPPVRRACLLGSGVVIPSQAQHSPTML
ncbi:uncharacterized [Tachysurus ichikawai]